MKVYCLNDILIQAYYELESQAKCTLSGTTLVSADAHFVAQGIQAGDKVFVPELGNAKVLAVISNTQLTLDHALGNGVVPTYVARALPELLFVQTLRITQKPIQVFSPQFRTQVKKKTVLGSDIQLELTGLLYSLSLHKTLTDSNQTFFFTLSYQEPDLNQAEQMQILGCSLVSCGQPNQETAISQSELVYQAAYLDIL